MTLQEIKCFFDSQLDDWELAAKNCRDLKKVKRKPFMAGDLRGFVQYNPARAVSTMAKVDKESILKRRCFLCEKERPTEQKAFDIMEGWKLLVNPFPILPYHFTIVNNSHCPQKLDMETGMRLASELDGMVVFFNDDGAGASAPDHMHFQAVPIHEVPLVSLLDKQWDNKENLSLPFPVITEVEELNNRSFPVNAFFWRSRDNSLRFVAVSRSCHRPREFFLDPPRRRAVSPGAIDMGGVIVTPFEDDFDSLDGREVENIYRQVTLSD